MTEYFVRGGLIHLILKLSLIFPKLSEFQSAHNELNKEYEQLKKEIETLHMQIADLRFQMSSKDMECDAAVKVSMKRFIDHFVALTDFFFPFL